MCRNIRVLANFQPPTTEEEIRAAALQYVRKISGLNAPNEADLKAFERAVTAIAATTGRLLESIHPRGQVRTREGEKAKGRERWLKREAALRNPKKPAHTHAHD